MNAAFWLRNVAAWSAQAAVLTSAAAAAAWLFRLRLPRLRLLYWQAVLAACLLLPAVEPWRGAATGEVEFVTYAGTAGPARQAPSRSLPWREVVLLALVCGCVGRVCWLGAGLFKLRRWRREADALPAIPAQVAQLRAEIAPGTEFRVTAGLSAPATFGMRRAVILLPRGFAELPPRTQEAVACHELLHVRRRDWVVTVIEQAVRAAMWFHPAIWWLTGQTQLAREQVVDGEAVAHTGNRGDYLNALLAMAGSAILDLAPAALFLRRRHLKDRVSLLVSEVTMTKRRMFSFCAASCGVLAAAGWIGLHTFPLEAAPVPQEAAQSNLLHSVPPKYPEAARRKGIEGDVVLEVHIDAEGHVSDAKVLSGPEELRSAALQAILQWHYSPQAMSLPAVTQVTMNFTLPKNGAAKQIDVLPILPPGKRVTIKKISVNGMTVTSGLLQQLPVHVGDTVDADGLRALAANVEAFDDHLTVAVAMIDDNNAEIQIRVPRQQIQVGRNVQQAKLIAKVNPVYPAEAKAQRIEGLVTLKAVIGKDGTIENLVLLSGDPMLAGAAMEAVRQWKYETTLLNGDPVEVVTQIDVNFTLAK